MYMKQLKENATIEEKIFSYYKILLPVSGTWSNQNDAIRKPKSTNNKTAKRLLEEKNKQK